MDKVYSHTMALCPGCGEKVLARIVKRGDHVYMEKFCPAHGPAQVLISTDVQWYESGIHYVKPGQEPLKRHTEFHGCPDSCGICTEHLQHICLPVIEITNRCQLDCPVCLKNAAPTYSLTVEEFGGIIANLLATEGKMDVVNISGGEPTLHPLLPEMIRLALDKGVSQVSVSSNGLELLHNPKLRELFKQTQTIAAIQFDGFSPGTYTFLRGRDLSSEKMELIRLLEAEDILYSLVATVAKGINDHEIPRLADFFFESGALTLMFQPVTFTGSAAQLDRENHRLTIPCIVHQLEKSHYIQSGDFHPLPCSHYSCFALSYYLVVGDGNFTGLKSFLGEENCVNICANRVLPALDNEGFTILTDRVYDMWSAADSSSRDQKIVGRIQSILRALNKGNFSARQKIALGAKHMKAIFIHHFMDSDTMDLGRLVKCCNPYPRTGDRVIPMCAENVFFTKLSRI